MSKELKVYSPYANRDGDVLLWHEGDTDLLLDDEDKVYLKEDVDALLAEKDAEIAELKRKLEDVTSASSINCEAVRRCNVKIRKISRALYKACANWAKAKQRRSYGLGLADWVIWGKMKRKCRAKAEEFK